MSTWRGFRGEYQEAREGGTGKRDLVERRSMRAAVHQSAPKLFISSRFRREPEFASQQTPKSDTETLHQTIQSGGNSELQHLQPRMEPNLNTV